MEERQPHGRTLKAENILPEVYNDDSQVVGFEQLTTAMLAEIKVIAIGREILKIELKKKNHDTL